MASVSKREWTSPKGEKKFAYEVRWLCDGRHNSKGGFTVKKDADAFKRKIEREMDAGTHTIPSQAHTVASVCEMYLRQAEDRFKDGRIGRSHYGHIRYAIDRCALPFFGSAKLADLTPVMVEDWYQWMVRDRGLKPTTARSRVGIFKRIEEFAQRRGFTKTLAVPGANKELAGIEQEKVKTFTVEEMQRILTILAERPASKKRRPWAMLACMVDLAAFGGLRAGEIFALRLEHVLLDKRVVRIRHNLTTWDELKGPKTRAGIRDVPIPVRTAQLLRSWLTTHYVENDRDLVFRTTSGGIVTRTNFHRQMWHPLLRRAGLDDGAPITGRKDWYHFHALRHFAASWMIENGLPVTEVASLLGHAKFDMTLQVYAHPVAGGHRRQSVMDQMADTLMVPAAPNTCARLSHHPLSP